MSHRQIDVTIQEGLSSPLSEDSLRSAALAALDSAFSGRDCQLTLALCDDDTIRALNAQYRGTDDGHRRLGLLHHPPRPVAG